MLLPNCQYLEPRLRNWVFTPELKLYGEVEIPLKQHLFCSIETNLNEILLSELAAAVGRVREVSLCDLQTITPETVEYIMLPSFFWWVTEDIYNVQVQLCVTLFYQLPKVPEYTNFGDKTTETRSKKATKPSGFNSKWLFLFVLILPAIFKFQSADQLVQKMSIFASLDLFLLKNSAANEALLTWRQTVSSPAEGF